jgi:hypothetical protein
MKGLLVGTKPGIQNPGDNGEARSDYEIPTEAALIQSRQNLTCWIRKIST